MLGRRKDTMVPLAVIGTISLVDTSHTRQSDELKKACLHALPVH